MVARRVCRCFIVVALGAALVPVPAFGANAPVALPGASSLARLTTGSRVRAAEPTESAGVIYRVRSGSTPDQIAARHGFGRSSRISAHAPQVAALAVPRGITTQQVVAKLQADPNVEYASPNYLRHTTTTYSSNPNDTYFRDATPFTIGGVAAPYTPMRSWWLRSQGLNITPVWAALGDTADEYGPKADPSAFKVAVLDTGFYLTHEDAGANIVGAKDEFATYSSTTDQYVTDSDVTPVDPSAQPYSDASDRIIESSHGTCVAGEIAAATDNSLGVAAAGWDAQVCIYKVQGIWLEGDPSAVNPDGSAAQPPNSAAILDGAIINGIYDATNDGCKIINMSFGGPEYSQAIQDAIDYAHAHGVVVVAAAGNDASTAPFYPASNAYVVSVGNEQLTGTPTSPLKARAYDSNYGSTLDVMAPGSWIYGLTQPGYDFDGPAGVYAPGYFWWSGTSMASPAVAGTLATLWRFKPELSPDQLVSYLENSASADGLRSDGVGYGYVNAYAAYRRIEGFLPVYRFYNKKNGSHFYTMDQVEKNSVLTKLSKAYSYDGVAYTVATADAQNDAPLYRFYNRKNGAHFYTADPAEKANVEAKFSDVYSYDGPAYDVCLTPVSGATTVWRFFDKKNGSHFYTTDPAEKAKVSADKATYSFDGPAFYLAP